MSPDEREAVDAFEDLGLTRYEAKVFIGLHRLGSGTARDVARVVDVPRSQVYGVAERLEERGLLDVQHAKPMRYRPVSLDSARETLLDRFERRQERAFEYVASVRDGRRGEEEREAVWTVRGRTRIEDRVVALLEDGTDRLCFGTSRPSLVPDGIDRLFEDRASAGIGVTILSSSPDVRNRFDSLDGARIVEPPAHGADDRSGRLVLVDDHTVLLSVIDESGLETAIWSEESLFASVLIQLIESSVVPPKR